MTNKTEYDNAPQWYHAGDYAGDYATTKQKPGKDKRLSDKSQRKALKAFRQARQNRHTY